MKYIASICHPRKWGLLDLSDALVFYGRQHHPEARYEGVHSFRALTSLLRQGLNGVAILWDNSPFSLFCAMACRLAGVTVVYYLHEPGGLGRKLGKNDPLFLMIAAALVEIPFQKLAHHVGISLYENIAHGDVLLPLLFLEDRPPPQPAPMLVGFLGARRRSRLPGLFAALEPQFREAGYTPAYFPSPQHGRSREDKFRFLANCAVVWNAYGVPLNQSAVTYDAILSSVPFFSSSFEPLREISTKLGLYHEIRLAEGPDAVKAQVETALDAIRRNGPPKIDFQTRSEIGGSACFKQYWLPFLQAL